MKKAHAGLNAGSFKSADNVVSVAVDSISGMLPSDLSALDPRGTIRNEFFVVGTEPTSIDAVHVYGSVCSESGYLNTPWCPIPVSKVMVRRPLPPDPLVEDFIYELPSYYCNLHNGDPSQYPIDPTKMIVNTTSWGNPDYPVVDPTLPPFDPNVEPDGI